MRILGVDPGSRYAGYACIESQPRRIELLTQGVLNLKPLEDPIEKRLVRLFEGLSQIIQTHRPQILVVEKVFFAKNAASALQLGQARGVVLLSGASRGLEIAEYSPTEIKLALTGYGKADKEQVAQMVQVIVGAQKFEKADASDALAIAICHAQHSANRVSSFQNQSAKFRTTKKRISLAEAVGLSSDSRKKPDPPV